MPRRCEFGCKTYGVDKEVIHRFPNPNKFPEQFKAWVSLVDGKSDKPSEYYKGKVICDKHFIDADKVRNYRLNRLAVPKLYLPGSGKFHSEPY